MKVFWDINKCWNKARNLYILFEKNINIPASIIIEKSYFHKLEKKDIFIVNSYILRPSFDDEDRTNKSNAWKYESIIFSSIELLIKKIKNDPSPLSYIIQEYIECDLYGVFFTRNPNSIFHKWFYEFNNNHSWITSWMYANNTILPQLREKELEFLWNNIENIFQYPQDIELWIKNNKFFIFQTRHITTWNQCSITYNKLLKLHGTYVLLDFDELWSNHDNFSYEIINNIIPCIYVNEKIYIKKSLLNIYYLLKYFFCKQTKYKNFHKAYKKYLIYKYLYKLKYLFKNKKVDPSILKEYYSHNTYSFNVNQKSIIKKINYYSNHKKTLDFINVENIKWSAFKQLENYKWQYSEAHNNSMIHINIPISKSLIFNHWVLLNNNHSRNDYIWLYKSKIEWTLVSKDNITSSDNNVLFIEDFDVDIYDILGKISWIIIKNGNFLSHNSIVIREYKIPCIIQYDKYNLLKEWKKITIQ